MSSPRAPQASFAPAMNDKPDFWTITSVITNGITSFISNTYWLGGIIDLAANLEDNGAGLSWWGLGFGAGLSAVVAAGTGYAAYTQNIRFQDHSKHPSIGQVNQQESEAPLSSDDERSPLVPRTQPSLSLLQKAALAGYAVTYTGDNAGVISFVGQIAAKERLPLYGKILLQCGATLFGAFASGAEIRNCKRNMEHYVKQQQEHQLTEIQVHSGPNIN